MSIKKRIGYYFSNNRILTFNDYFYTALTIGVFFIILYYGAEMYSRSVSVKFHMYFDWENRIPFIKIALVPYFAIFFLPLLIPIYIKDSISFYKLALKLTVSIFLSFLIFVIFPSELGYSTKPIGKKLNSIIDLIAGRHNLFPSLHVTLTLVIIHSILPFCKKLDKLLLLSIAFVLPLSTVFAHQHHIFDVFLGIILFLFINKTIV